MSDFTAIGQLVTEARNLLDSIKGGAIRTMQATFDNSLVGWGNKLDAAIAKYTADFRNVISPAADQLPNIALTGNQALSIVDGNTVPTAFKVNAHTTVELVKSIPSSPTARDGNALSLLTEIESDVRKAFNDFSIQKNSYYKTGFNIIRLSWDFSGGSPGWLIYPTYKGTSVPIASLMTAAAFIKLESGDLSVNSAFAEGAALGEWRFTKRTYLGSSFGSYTLPHPYANSDTGSMLIALPVIGTGYIDHPKKLFALPEIGE
ncbi:hypothetical protein AB6D74_20055 [Vibrio cyclitrophicus]|uniref:hypothetical protein n=1 Tax=Vibrio cyclitrophicus TaxID=47951 RepID=UPI000C860C77|nr:hypothetical protein [Vibrio cyclitrophicus]PMI48216.1 hypothetical protein BCU44_21495 [Vibrio cyclitrophicus]